MASRGRKWAVLGATGACLALAGCGQTLSTPPLSDIIKVQGSVLTSEQQQKAIQDLNEKKATHEVEVARQIEKAR